MKHALFIVFHYPPESSSSGVLRTLKFSRYLPEYGWRVTVVTLRADAYEQRDEQLLTQIPADVTVVRTRYINTARHLSIFGRYPAALAIPDRWIGWAPFAIAAADEVHASDPVDLVFSTSPIATAHLIAKRISRRHRLPWVADFRDPWYEDPPEPGTPAIVHWAARHLEASVIKAADAVVTTTEHLSRMLMERYPAMNAGKVNSILNGYDEADFTALSLPPPVKSDRLRLVHAGEINPGFRDPRPLLRALRLAIETGRLNEREFELTFIGGGDFTRSAELRKVLQETRLEESVRFLPRIPYRDALRKMAESDILLLLQASEDTRQLVPAKLYEYMRLQRPVFALVFDGVTADIVSDNSAGWTVDPRDDSLLATRLAEGIGLWREGGLAQRVASMDRLRRYERRALTGQLAVCFDKLTGLRRDGATGGD